MRPKRCRKIGGDFYSGVMKPSGIPKCQLEEVFLCLDEIEAIRLVDLEQLYQSDAAEQMHISRQTLGNIIKKAHQKIADALINGKALRLETPKDSSMSGQFMFCPACGSTFQDESVCPSCDSEKVEKNENLDSAGFKKKESKK